MERSPSNTECSSIWPTGIKSWPLFSRGLSQCTYAMKHLMQFCERVKNQTGRYPREFCTDRGGQFVSNKWKEFCSSKGILLSTSRAHNFRIVTVEAKGMEICLIFESHISLTNQQPIPSCLPLHCPLVHLNTGSDPFGI